MFSMPTLRRLRLCLVDYSDATAQTLLQDHLQGLSNLERLEVAGSPSACISPRATSPALEIPLRSLKALDVSTLAGIWVKGHFPDLEFLDCHGKTSRLQRGGALLLSLPSDPRIRLQHPSLVNSKYNTLSVSAEHVTFARLEVPSSCLCTIYRYCALLSENPDEQARRVEAIQDACFA